MFSPRANRALSRTEAGKARNAISERNSAEEMAIFKPCRRPQRLENSRANYRMQQQKAKNSRIPQPSCPHKDNKTKHSLQSQRQKCKSKQTNLVPIPDISQSAAQTTTQPNHFASYPNARSNSAFRIPNRNARPRRTPDAATRHCIPELHAESSTCTVTQRVSSHWQRSTPATITAP